MAGRKSKTKKYITPVAIIDMERPYPNFNIVDIEIRGMIYTGSTGKDAADELKAWKKTVLRDIHRVLEESYFHPFKYIVEVTVSDFPTREISQYKATLVVRSREKEDVETAILLDEAVDYINRLFLRIIDNLPEGWLLEKNKKK